MEEPCAMAEAILQILARYCAPLTWPITFYGRFTVAKRVRGYKEMPRSSNTFAGQERVLQALMSKRYSPSSRFRVSKQAHSAERSYERMLGSRGTL